MASASFSRNRPGSRWRWLARIRRTMFIGLGPLATWWRWVSQQSRGPHQRHLAEEDQRRKRRQFRPRLQRLESRGSPGVPVDPAAMLMAGISGLAVAPEGLFGSASLPFAPVEITGGDSASTSTSSLALGPVAENELPSLLPARTPSADLARPDLDPETTALPVLDDVATTSWQALPAFFPAAPPLPASGGPDGVPPPIPVPASATNGLANTTQASPASIPGALPPGPKALAPAGLPDISSYGVPPMPAKGKAGGATSATPAATVTLQSVTTPIAPGSVGLPAGATGSIRFELNEGQVASQARFLARGSQSTLFLTDQAAVLDMQNPPTPGSGGAPATVSGTVLETSFVGANAVKPIGVEVLPGYTNYLIGNDPSDWQTNVPSYAGVEYPNLYPGISLIYYGNAQSQLEYDFVVAPGANPGAIRLQVQGDLGLSLDSQGNLVIHTANSGDVTQSVPRLYQTVAAGGQQAVAGEFVLNADGTVGFSVGPYDHGRALDIDPAIVYSTYLGGNFADDGSGLAVDRQRSMYVTGVTTSTNFPVTPGAYQGTLSKPQDAFVTKISSSGALVYSTYIGGAVQPGPPPPAGTTMGYVDSVGGIALNSSGDAFITGQVNVSTYPTTANAYQSRLPSLNGSAFLTELNTTGAALLYSSFLGGTTATAVGTGVVVDANGQPIVAGYTDETNFPTVSGAYQSANAGGTDGFVTMFAPTGTLTYSTYLGGSGTDEINGIAAFGDGAYVTGSTTSTNFPVTSGAYRTSFTGNQMAFITQLNASGGLADSTYLGGLGNTGGNAIALDSSSSVYVTGGTTATNFPTTSGAAQSSYGGNQDAFVAELTSALSGLTVGTYLGGTQSDVGTTIGVDPQGNIAVAGYTGSTNFPTAAAFQTTPAGSFVTKLQSNGSMLWSSYLGGSGGDSIAAGALDGIGNLYVTGSAGADFPVTSNAAQGTYGGNTDAFATEVVGQGMLGLLRTDDPVQAPPNYVPWGVSPNGSSSGNGAPGGEFDVSAQMGDLQVTQGIDLLQHCPDG